MSAPRIRMADPAREYAALAAELQAALGRVLASGRYVLGPEGEAFEARFAEYCGARYAVGVNSGTDALHLALRAAGVGAGDEVIVPGFSFVATASAVAHCGARPVFADIDPATYGLCERSVSALLGPRTRAVIAVHLFGQCAAIGEISALCQAHRVALVEDCAQAVGADYASVRAGAWGDFGCFSFYPTKNLAACGDGGIITAREERHAERLRMLRHHGSRGPRTYEIIGYNSRLDEIQAAVLRVKLAYLDRWNEARGRNAARYRERLAEAALALPAEHGKGRHVYHQYTLRSPRRDALRAALERAGIESAIFYPRPLYREPVLAAHARGELPNCEAAAREVLSIPIHPFLSEEDIERTSAVLRAS